MKEIIVEWKHYDKEGETCTRCNNTGDNIKKVLKKISKDAKFKNLNMSYKETKLEAEEMPESNSIFINGKPIEDILSATASENYCHSCSCLAGAGTNCRTLKYLGDTYESISEEIILKAISVTIK